MQGTRLARFKSLLTRVKAIAKVTVFLCLGWTDGISSEDIGKHDELMAFKTLSLANCWAVRGPSMRRPTFTIYIAPDMLSQWVSCSVAFQLQLSLNFRTPSLLMC